MGGVPINRPAQPLGDAAELADRSRAVTDLGVADRLFAAADAIDPVAEMISRFVQVDIVGAQGRPGPCGPPLLPGWRLSGLLLGLGSQPL